LYWLTAGYACVPGTLATLVVVLAAVTGLLALWACRPRPRRQPRASATGSPPVQRDTLNLPGTPPIPAGALADRVTDAGRIERAARTAIGAVVFRDTGQQLTTPGRYPEMAGRLLGPVVLALALLDP
jgi:hypothetical protein